MVYRNMYMKNYAGHASEAHPNFKTRLLVEYMTWN